MKLILFSLVLFVSTATLANDSVELKEIFDQDQAARSEEALASGAVPSLQEEKERRVAVLRLLAQERVKTASDYLRAALLLHHTPIWEAEDGKASSISAENHILAFFLAGRAHELGHEHGMHFLAWTYNYYLRGVGCNIDTYGYEASSDYVAARDSAILGSQRQSDCGFDPQPYLVDFGVAKSLHPKVD